MRDEAAQLLGLLIAADEGGAVRLARRLTETGMSREQVLLDVVAPVQAQIGELWAAGRLSVAQEHVASYICERVTAACADQDAPQLRPEPLVVACADGEWHALPPRLLAETLRLRGWPVTFLGASVPAGHLTSYLQQRNPAAVLVSIALPVRLPAARRCVLAAQQAGVPVLVGGRGFGDSPQWAQRLGADAWAGDAVQAAAALTAWPPQHDARADLEHLADGEYARLMAQAPQLVGDAMDALERRFAPMRGYRAAQRDATVEDLGHVVAFLAAALYIDDAAVFTRFVVWLVQVLGARGVPAESVAVLLEFLQEALAGRTRSAAIVAAGRAALDGAGR